MRHIFIETEQINSINSLHDYLKNVFEFPGYYGGNLDALYDCLTELSDYVTVTIPIFLEDMLGGYGKRVIKVFEDAAKYNERLKLRIEE